MKESTISFYDNHLPALQDGEYTINVTQNVTAKDNTPPADKTAPAAPTKSGVFSSQELKLYVNGPRFYLSPSEIHNVFPQDGAKGDFEGTLPSISFTRSTLLWERGAKLNDNTTHAPWLYLLLVDESELNTIKEVTHLYSDLFTLDGNRNKNLTALGSALGIQNADDLTFIEDKPIQTIDLTNFALSIIPGSLDELKYLGYTRIHSEPTNNEEHCVVVGNRLPKPGSSSTVFLISLENKYTANGSLDMERKIFPVLQKWKFYTNDDQLYSIEANLGKIAVDDTCKNLDDKVKKSKEIFDTTIAFKGFLSKNQVAEIAIKKMLHLCKLPGGSFHDVMSNLSNGIMPLTLPLSLPLPKSEGIKLTGSVNLKFQRVINKTNNEANALYRGPLASQIIDLKTIFTKKPLFVDFNKGYVPDRVSDLFLVYQGSTDTTYAVAYELGKLTALNDTAFSSAFYEWKHEVAAAKLLEKNANKNQVVHLPYQNKYKQDSPMPQAVKDKFENWKLLKGIPIRYLVPDPTMVPTECIRYFKVDNNWVNAFIMGAFSIGHTARVDFKEELKSLFVPQGKLISGFILNSLAVSVWHDYELDCTTSLSGNATATPLRKSNLDKFTHIYLFDGQISQLKFHLHPGKLHPGFMVEKTMKGTTYHKSIGDCTNYINQASRVVSITTTPKPDNSTKSLSFLSALTGIPDSVKGNPGSVGKFNSQLMEGTPEVVFKLIDQAKK